MALAAGGGGESAAHDDGAAFRDLLYRILNFVLLAVILVVVVVKTPVKNLLSKRRDDIARKMEELQESKEAFPVGVNREHSSDERALDHATAGTSGT